MRLQIKGLAELRARLEQVRPEVIMAKALAEQAERMAEAVRDGLSESQGSGGHDKPWVRTGALRDSIAATANGLEAAIGSNDPAAAPQEMGTSHIPPRPFLAPVAANMGEQAAREVGKQVAAALKGEQAPLKGSDGIVDVSSSGTDVVLDLLGLGLAGALYLGFRQNGRTPSQATNPNAPTILQHSESQTEAPTPDPTGIEINDEARAHILDGDASGGGHRAGQNLSGKTEFPSAWSDDEVLAQVRDVANDPSSVRQTQPNGRIRVDGTRQGVGIRVIIGPDNRSVVTAFPTNTPRNP